MQLKRTRRVAFDARSLALFASLALGGGLASAQFSSGPGPAAPTSTRPAADAFSQADTDGNGSISRQEALRAGTLARTFDKLDANGDGALSRAEFEASTKPPSR